LTWQMADGEMHGWISGGVTLFAAGKNGNLR
jgi:hypothetical protein